MENTWLSYRILLATQGSIYGENSCRYTILVHLAYKQVYPDHQWKFRTEPSISKALAHNSLSTWTVSCIFLGNKSKYLSCGLTLDWLPAHIMGQCYDGIIGTTARLIRVQLRDWSHILADFHPLVFLVLLRKTFRKTSCNCSRSTKSPSKEDNIHNQSQF